MAQVTVNGLFAVSQILMFALGLSLIYRVAGFLHFALGVVFTGAALAFFALTEMSGLPSTVGAILSVILAAFSGCLMEFVFFGPLRRRSAPALISMLASLGIYVVIQNTVSIAFGDETVSIGLDGIRKSFCVLGATVTPLQMATVCTAFALTLLLAAFLLTTKMGRAVRAVSNDRALAEVSGISIDRVYFWAFGLGSSFAAIAGIVAALDVGLRPTMGMNPLMMAAIAVIVGGARGISGIALGALLLGAAQQLGAWFISSQWQDVIAFGILLVFLLLKPEGFMGRKARKVTL